MKPTIYMLFFCIMMILSSIQVISSPIHSQGASINSTQMLDPPVYPSTPDWISANPHYSTGGALADINKDGWLDLIVADGNDILLGHLNVFYNDGSGNFCTTCNWQSTDVAYNGHIDVSDVNGDGWSDVAVAHLGTSSTFAPIARIYMNNAGTLSSLPDWEANINGNAFSCAFGDMNNDGRPDLAIATGWAYSPQHHYKNYVYLNDNGVLEANPSWESADMNDYQNALWVDADYDGWLDLAYVGRNAETQVYRNLGGVLETTASWYTSDSGSQDGLMLTVGDVNQDGYLDLFTADNNQLTGGSGYFKQYLGISSGFFQTTASWSYYEGYCSAVASADVNGDDLPDLATGGWWDNTRLFLNTGGSLPAAPSYSSGSTSVVEKIVFGNIGPSRSERIRSVTFTGDGSQQLFHLPHQNIQYINTISQDGVLLSYDEYMYNREYGWIVTSSPPSSSLEVRYNQSRSLDMIVTNWDSSIGNYLYYNRLYDTDLAVSGSLEWTNVQYNEIVYGSFLLKNIGDPNSQLDWMIQSTPGWGNWSIVPSSGNDLTPEMGSQLINVELMVPSAGGPLFEGEIVIVNSEDPDDVDIVSVHVEISGAPGPAFNIDSISGNIGVTVSFSNIGDESATHSEYVLQLSGGMLNRINKTVTNIIDSMESGESVSVRSGLLLGLGRITINFSVRCMEGASKETTVEGSQFIIFTFLK